MKHFQFTGLLLDEGWLMPAYVDIDDDGIVQYLNQQPSTNLVYDSVEGYVLPGIPNTHSHAFQYAMAGLTETHSVNIAQDDFWSWRNAMYELALNINPSQLENIAAQLYSEMLRHGYSHVIEFHYLHHDKKGKFYENIAEMGLRLINAAKISGIKITLVPILYQKSGFDQEPLPEQKRFIHDTLSDYWKMLEASSHQCQYYDYASCGVGIHSLRAVDPHLVTQFCKEIDPSMVFHIHLSEQLKEIDDCMIYLGQRPVEWFADNINLGPQHNLVHCTHLTKNEIQSLGRSEATVVLCPSTEGNLGDGIFPLTDYMAKGGNWSIGTDSHIGLNPFEELRLLDYGQRLISHRRDSFTTTKYPSSGQHAMNQIIKCGRQSAGVAKTQFFQVGHAFDACVIDASHPLVESTGKTHLLNTMIYSSDSRMILGTLVNGAWIVKNGIHKSQNEINKKFLQSMKELQNRIG